MIQDRLGEAVFLHIARLTDPPFSFGKSNLTLLSLPGLIEDLKLKEAVEKRCGTALLERRSPVTGKIATSHIATSI
jgi:hypothetical protein